VLVQSMWEVDTSSDAQAICNGEWSAPSFRMSFPG